MFSNLSKSKVFLISCILFIIGIALASFLPAKILQYDLWIFGVIVGLVAMIIFIKYCRNRALSCSYFLFLLFFLLGIWRYSIALPQDTPDKIWYYNKQKIEFIGVINKEPDVRMYNQKLTIAVQSVETLHTTSLPVKGNVLVTTKLFPEYHYGDELKINCELENPAPFNEFAYDRYLARHGVYSLCYYPVLRFADGKTTDGKPSFVKTTDGKPVSQWTYGKILQIKNKLKDSINYGLVEPEASLLQAIILGNRRGLSPEMLNIFSCAGISHIIAISGMHIAIISVIIMNLLLAVGASRRWSFILTSGGLLFYIILIGLPASAMRAGLMAFTALLAIQLGRLNRMTNSLLMIACILLLINPRMLRDDIGFQLSFLAVSSIVYIKPVIDLWISKIKIVEARHASSLLKGIRDVITVTLAAQVLTLPIIALNFHQVSIVSPLVNVLVLFLLPFIMVSGMLATVLGAIFTDLAWLFFAPVYLMLKYVILIAEKSVHLPLAYLEIEYIWIGWIILFYVVVGWGIWWYNRDSYIVN